MFHVYWKSDALYCILFYRTTQVIFCLKDCHPLDPFVWCPLIPNKQTSGVLYSCIHTSFRTRLIRSSGEIYRTRMLIDSKVKAMVLGIQTKDIESRQNCYTHWCTIVGNNIPNFLLGALSFVTKYIVFNHSLSLSFMMPIGPNKGLLSTCDWT